MSSDRESRRRAREEKLLADNKAFFDEVTAPDDRLAIREGQTYVETMLGRILQKHGISLKLNFSARVAQAQQHQLVGDALAAQLRRVGKIRNVFSHELGATLEPDDVSNLLAAFSDPEDQTLIDFLMDSMRLLFAKRASSHQISDDQILVRSALIIVYTSLMDIYFDDGGALLAPSPVRELLERVVDVFSEQVQHTGTAAPADSRSVFESRIVSTTTSDSS